MRITEVHVYPVAPHHGLVAFANLVLEEKLLLRSIAIYEKLDGTGYRITYPTKGKSYLFHPIHNSFSKSLERAIISELKTVLSKAHARHNRPDTQSNPV